MSLITGHIPHFAFATSKFRKEIRGLRLLSNVHFILTLESSLSNTLTLKSRTDFLRIQQQMPNANRKMGIQVKKPSTGSVGIPSEERYSALPPCHLGMHTDLMCVRDAVPRPRELTLDLQTPPCLPCSFLVHLSLWRLTVLRMDFLNADGRLWAL
jgi:hypothetical protein